MCVCVFMCVCVGVYVCVCVCVCRYLMILLFLHITYLSSCRLEIVQGDKLVPILDWFAADQVMVKLYKPDQPGDWTGIVWHGNGAQVPSCSSGCGLNNEYCDEKTNTKTNDNILLISGIIIFSMAVILGGFIVRKYIYETKVKDIGSVNIPWSDIKLMDSHIGRKFPKGVYREHPVIIEYLDVNVDLTDTKVRIDIKNIRELKHENICHFMGICISRSSGIVIEFVQRGSVKNIIAESDIKLTNDVKLSFLTDIVCGMNYLHHSSVGFHGFLTSSKCLVDSRLTCKITGHGLWFVKRVKKLSFESLNPCQLLWLAPEILRQASFIKATSSDIKMADVYSFAIVMQEIVLATNAFGFIKQDMEVTEIIELVKSEQLRPDIPENVCKPEWSDLMKTCWNENPFCRPSFPQILSALMHANRGKDINLVDTMVVRLETYTKMLEDRVEAKSQELKAEKEKIEVILKELLPDTVAVKLIHGQQIEPEAFDSVTVFFSDIVGFTKIASILSPLEIVHMLNSMYTSLDDIISRFDVYKVATIGDAYVVASGVPVPNGERHAEEICMMALEFLTCCSQTITINDDNLLMRIGIHTGPCVAGVAGVKMPRYLLFGDTVDIAARMESGGKAMNIQISECTAALVKHSNKFELEFNKEVEIKGKGVLLTYWVTDINK